MTYSFCPYSVALRFAQPLTLQPRNFREGKAQRALIADSCALLVVPVVTVRMRAEHSFPPVEFHDLLREGFTLPLPVGSAEVRILRHIHKATTSCVMSVRPMSCVSVRPSVQLASSNNSNPIRRIFVKFYSGNFCQNVVTSSSCSKYHTTNKCTDCMSFILNHFFKTLSLLLHVSIAYRLSSSGSTYSS